MRFSLPEKQDLLKAWLAVSFSFAVLNSSLFSFVFVLYFLISMFTVGIGMLLHEIAHKYVAQRYGCNAEFRANNQMLIFAVASSLLFGLFFAAPGAVWISGHVTKEKNGKISLAGPMTNILIALIFLGIQSLNTQNFLADIASFGFQINAWIGLFNMIPFLNFDGEKILAWNKIAYAATVIFAAFLVFVPTILQALKA